ncbi:MAG: BMP family ABC transporter substrate-binding protein [Spirochaetales bacterium]|nr:BMP family ABC transporter substrate-binding protein [Spirochaetales bacterium]
MKNFMKVTCFALLLVMSGTLLWAGGAQDTETMDEKLIMAMVTNQSGLGDQSFNDAAWEGLGQAESELGIERKVLESREQAQYVPNLSTLAEQNASLIVGVGFMIKDAVAETADMFPDSNFAMIDGFVDLPNVASISFKENEGAFLIGAIAAKVSKTGTIGFVGGMSTPVTNRFEAGYRAGALTANPNIEILISYAGTFADAAKGEEMANPQYDQGADVIFQVAGQTGLGVINAAKKKGKFVVGVDRDQNYLAPENVLSSMIKRVDIAVFNVCKLVNDGAFKGGPYSYGIREGAVDYATSGGLIPSDVIDYAESLKKKILSGDIVPPGTYDELDAFTPPSM